MDARTPSRPDAAPSGPAERLAAIRREIDATDTELLGILNRRAALSLEVGRIKAGEPGIIFKPLREKEVLDNLVARNPGPLPEGHLRAVWREILSSSRALQRPQNVAYLGPEGTFSYFAGVEYLGHAAHFRPCSDIARVFEEVAGGQCELGVVPLEKSLQGTVGVSFDLFLRHDVYIQAELFSRISHCLLSNAPSLAHVRTVYSHPQPLAQCGGWLRTHLPGAALIPVESTAAAARR
ncbi:MAG: chorismate mutase, partial [Desulfovibrio sp.]|nr:chorismate mutase [Desulfovibrio sp.]